MMFLVALLPKAANEQLQEWKLKLVTDLGPEGTSPVYPYNGFASAFHSEYTHCGETLHVPGREGGFGTHFSEPATTVF